MADETIGNVTSLLEQVLEIHSSVRHVVLSTKEGVVVASVSKREETDARLTATVSAALSWAGITTFSQLDASLPEYIIHTTKLEHIVTLVQPHYQLVVVLSKADTAGLDIEKTIPTLQSTATRIEILMGSIPAFSEETILGRIVEEIPEINQAMLLTMEGLPLSAVGFMNQIEVAGIAGSIFANGLTYSLTTGEIEINAEDIRLMLFRLDDAKLLLVVCRGPNAHEVGDRVKHFLQLMP